MNESEFRQETIKNWMEDCWKGRDNENNGGSSLYTRQTSPLWEYLKQNIYLTVLDKTKFLVKVLYCAYNGYYRNTCRYKYSFPSLWLGVPYWPDG